MSRLGSPFPVCHPFSEWLALEVRFQCTPSRNRIHAMPAGNLRIVWQPHRGELHGASIRLNACRAGPANAPHSLEDCVLHAPSSIRQFEAGICSFTKVAKGRLQSARSGCIPRRGCAFSSRSSCHFLSLSRISHILLECNELAVAFQIPIGHNQVAVITQGLGLAQDAHGQARENAGKRP